MKKDYYDILGVSRDSTQDEIKKSYRKLAFDFHPDRNPDDHDAASRFKEISSAYEVLSDSDRRAQYDSYSHLSSDGIFTSGPFASGFNSLFDDLFGEVFNTGRRQRAQRGVDLRYDLEIGFNEAAFGVEKEITVPRGEICTKCKGAGAEEGGAEPCAYCQGSGTMRYTEGIFTVNRACTQCGGRGYVIEVRCDGCEGIGMVAEDKKVMVRVPAGVDDGMRLKMRGEGERVSVSGDPGDLYVIVHVREHEFFSRQNSDIYCEVPISFSTAVLGGKVEIPTLESLKSIDIKQGTQSGDTIKLKGSGVAVLGKNGKRGDLYVILQVEVPSSLSREQKKLMESFREIEKDTGSSKVRRFKNRLEEYSGKKQ